MHECIYVYMYVHAYIYVYIYTSQDSSGVYHPPWSAVVSAWNFPVPDGDRMREWQPAPIVFGKMKTLAFELEPCSNHWKTMLWNRDLAQNV